MAHVMLGIFLVWLLGALIALIVVTGSYEHEMSGPETSAWILFWFLLVPPLIIKALIRGMWQAGKRIVNF